MCTQLPAQNSTWDRLRHSMQHNNPPEHHQGELLSCPGNVLHLHQCKWRRACFVLFPAHKDTIKTIS